MSPTSDRQPLFDLPPEPLLVEDFQSGFVLATLEIECIDAAALWGFCKN